jgi:phytanoyl-CoA hydroxylase
MSYNEDGFLIVENVLTSEECDSIVNAAKGIDSFKQGNTRPVMQAHTQVEKFHQAMQHPNILKQMQQSVRGPVSGLQTEFFYGKPGTPGFSAHQDNAFVQAPYGAFASAWIALADVSPENGGLIVWRGSHKEPLLETTFETDEEHPDQDPNAYKYACPTPEKYEQIDVTVPKGSVVFIHGNVIHASHENRSTDWRYVLLCTYAREGEPFREGRYAKRKAVPLEQPKYVEMEVV